MRQCFGGGAVGGTGVLVGLTTGESVAAGTSLASSLRPQAKKTTENTVRSPKISGRSLIRYAPPLIQSPRHRGHLFPHDKRPGSKSSILTERISRLAKGYDMHGMKYIREDGGEGEPNASTLSRHPGTPEPVAVSTLRTPPNAARFGHRDRPFLGRVGIRTGYSREPACL